MPRLPPPYGCRCAELPRRAGVDMIMADDAELEEVEETADPAEDDVNCLEPTTSAFGGLLLGGTRPAAVLLSLPLLMADLLFLL